MSLVPPTGLLRKLYDDALHYDIEYTSSAFWQAIFQQHFRVEQDFVSVCEYSPDESRDRTDITVLRYDGTDNTLALMKVVEIKRAGTSPKTAETDALTSAAKAIQKYSLLSIYAMSIWGTRFRLWRVDSNELSSLQPCDGQEAQFGLKKCYIDADSDGAFLFTNLVNLIKNLHSTELSHGQQDFRSVGDAYESAGGFDVPLTDTPLPFRSVGGRSGYAQLVSTAQLQWTTGDGSYASPYAPSTGTEPQSCAYTGAANYMGDVGRDASGQTSTSYLYDPDSAITPGPSNAEESVEPVAGASAGNPQASKKEKSMAVTIRHLKTGGEHSFVFTRSDGKDKSTKASDWERWGDGWKYKKSKQGGTIYTTAYDFSRYRR